MNGDRSIRISNKLLLETKLSSTCERFLQPSTATNRITVRTFTE